MGLQSTAWTRDGCSVTTIDLRDRVGLSPEEDGVLRRLHFFEMQGITLADQMRQLKAELRARDKRIDIREPDASRILWPLPA
jgi:hypothetical protein